MLYKQIQEVRQVKISIIRHWAIRFKRIHLQELCKLLSINNLRSVDIDGKSELSQVKTIRIGKKNEQSVTILTYPNPVSTELRVTIPTNWQGKKVSYELLNSNGQVVLRNITTIGSQTESMNVNSIAPGFYIVKVTANGETAHQKIIKR